MDKVFEHLDRIATEAGLVVMDSEGILGIIADRETVSYDTLLALTADNVTDLYHTYIGPAIDGIEDSL